ncbi:MAG: DUF4369 domain-containing protein [Bacteroidales bacterium]|nr:DUF4369 domain-containing protein [Bacteroidales bacterium]
MTLKNILAGVATAMLLAACSSQPRFTVEGTVTGAEGDQLILEASHNGSWWGVDTTEVGNDGRFRFRADAAGYPDIYRLRLGSEMIYFPIDSIETVTITADKAAFATQYSLRGTAAAEAVARVDSLLRVHQPVDSLTKRDLAQIALADPAGIVAYYIIQKTVNGMPLYNPANRQDLRVIGAVANCYTQQRPLDPRTEYLKSLYLRNRKASIAQADTMVVAALPLIDFALSDETGTAHKLSQIASKGDVVLLNFTVYDADGSLEFNRLLASLYEQRHSQGLEIVQVAVDDDQFAWAKSAKNIPWIALYAPATTRAKILMSYNVVDIPTTFIINRQGELVERVDDPEKIPSAVSRYL